MVGTYATQCLKNTSTITGKFKLSNYPALSYSNSTELTFYFWQKSLTINKELWRKMLL